MIRTMKKQVRSTLFIAVLLAPILAATAQMTEKSVLNCRSSTFRVLILPAWRRSSMGCSGTSGMNWGKRPKPRGSTQRSSVEVKDQLSLIHISKNGCPEGILWYTPHPREPDFQKDPQPLADPMNPWLRKPLSNG